MEPSVPIYYVLRRGLDDAEIESASALLSLTPCQAAVISRLDDYKTASKFGVEVFCATSGKDALHYAEQLAKTTGRPLLVIGEADFLNAVHTDGTIECFSKQTKMN